MGASCDHAMGHKGMYMTVIKQTTCTLVVKIIQIEGQIPVRLLAERSVKYGPTSPCLYPECWHLRDP